MAACLLTQHIAAGEPNTERKARRTLRSHAGQAVFEETQMTCVSKMAGDEHVDLWKAGMRITFWLFAVLLVGFPVLLLAVTAAVVYTLAPGA